jgi:hypothetical protein
MCVYMYKLKKFNDAFAFTFASACYVHQDTQGIYLSIDHDIIKI